MIAEKVLKDICFAFPSSTNAKILGFEDVGCWHLSIIYIGIEGSDQCETFMPHNAEGFTDRNDPDLMAMFEEADGQCAREYFGA